ncbi:MAG: FAD-dependent oxidoreductase, partial [Mycobacterium sp.]|nr:FAD-dependent oxidoreductase [Mycobacterium sp.]
PAETKVAVVGAGIAGLTAAFRLQQAGAEVLVLERQNRVGGRMSTINVNGFVIDVGAGILSSTYREMLQLIDDAGLTRAIEPSGGPLGVVRDGRVHRFRNHRELFAETLLGERARIAFHEIVQEAKGYHDLFDWDDAGRGARLDTEDIASYAARRAPAELMEYFIEPMCHDIWLTSPRNLSVVNLFFYLSRVVGNSFFNSPAGVGFLPAGLAEIVPVQTAATVRYIEPQPDGVTVTWERQGGPCRTENFDAGIVAVPAPHVAGLCPGLTPPLRELFSAITYARSIEVFVGLERPPDEPAMWVQMGRADPDLASIVMDHHKAPSHVPSGRGLVSSFWRPEWCAQRWGDDDHTIATDALRKLDMLYPGLSDTVLFTHVQRWDPCVVAHRPGGFHTAERLAKSLNPDSRVHFAGDYFAISTTNSSVHSGTRAARRILSQLSPDRVLQKSIPNNDR